MVLHGIRVHKDAGTFLVMIEVCRTFGHMNGVTTQILVVDQLPLYTSSDIQMEDYLVLDYNPDISTAAVDENHHRYFEAELELKLHFGTIL